MAFFACVLAVTMGSCDKNDDPKVPDLKCTPSKVEVAPGKTATVTVSGGTAPFTVTSSDSKIATAKADKNTIYNYRCQKWYSDHTHLRLKETYRKGSCDGQRYGIRT